MLSQFLSVLLFDTALGVGIFYALIVYSREVSMVGQV